MSSYLYAVIQPLPCLHFNQTNSLVCFHVGTEHAVLDLFLHTDLIRKVLVITAK